MKLPSIHKIKKPYEIYPGRPGYVVEKVYIVNDKFSYIDVIMGKEEVELIQHLNILQKEIGQIKMDELWKKIEEYGRIMERSKR